MKTLMTGIVATNLGDVSEALATFVTTLRAAQTKGAKRMFFCSVFLHICGIWTEIQAL